MIYKKNLLEGIIKIFQDEMDKLWELYRDLSLDPREMEKLREEVETLDRHTGLYLKGLNYLARSLRRGTAYSIEALRSTKEALDFYSFNILELIKELGHYSPPEDGKADFLGPMSQGLRLILKTNQLLKDYLDLLEFSLLDFSQEG